MLNEINLQLREKNKKITETFSDTNAFKGKLSLLEAQLMRGDFKQFENLAATKS